MTSDNPEEAVLATPDRLEQTFESAKVVNGANPTGDILNAFMGTEELISMGQNLLKHMRDEDQWGESNMNFEPYQFVAAAYEVARDQTAGEPIKTKVHVEERQPLKITFNIFIGFWLPRIAKVAYGEEYASDVRGIVESVRPPKPLKR